MVLWITKTTELGTGSQVGVWFGMDRDCMKITCTLI